MIRKILVASFAVLLGACATCAGANAAELTEKDVERIVARFIEENGDIVSQSISNYNTKRLLEDAAKRVAPHTPTSGAEDAQVTFIEFSDFDCPFCSRVQPTLTEIQRRYKSRVKFAFKHLPLEALHPKAIDAAKAAQAAHRQGKFWEFRKGLFDRQEFSGEQLWLDLASELKLDITKFNKDRKSKEIETEVMIDLQDANDLNARGTPFFLINGQPLSGAQPLEAFVAIIEDQLKKAEALGK